MSLLFSRFSFYIALAGLLYAGTLVLRLSAKDPVPQPPHAPPVNPYAHAVAAAGLVEAQGENIALGVPVAGLVTAVLVRVWDKVEPGQPLLQLDDRDARPLQRPAAACVPAHPWRARACRDSAFL